MDVEQEIRRIATAEGQPAEWRAQALADLAPYANTADAINALARAAQRLIGEDMNGWAEAAALIDSVVGKAPPLPGLQLEPALVARAVVYGVVGDGRFEALLAQLPASSSEERRARAVEVRLFTVDALLRAGCLRRSTSLYREALKAEFPGRVAPKTVAVVSHNLASALLASTERDGTDEELMEVCAREALRAWREIGNWLNWARAEYTLAAVLSALKQYSEARTHSEKGIGILKENGGEIVDEAFLRLTLAQCYCGMGDTVLGQEELCRATSLRERFPSQDLKEWFDDELGKAKLDLPS